MGLTLLAHASVPLKFWDEAFLTAVFIISRLPSKVIDDQSPYERLHGKLPDYSFFAYLWVCRVAKFETLQF